MEALTYLFWITTLGIPSTVFLFGVLTRYFCKSEQNLFSDVLLFYFGFDVAVICQAKDFEKYVVNKELQELMIPIFLGMTLVTIVTWIGFITKLEPMLGHYRSIASGQKMTPQAQLLITFSGIVVTIFTVANFSFFTLGQGQ